jgi:hypothetical protein
MEDLHWLKKKKRKRKQFRFRIDVYVCAIQFKLKNLE